MKRDFERRACQDGVDTASVAYRLVDLRSRLIGYREWPQLPQPIPRFLFTKSRARRFLEPVRPAASRLGEPPFECRIINDWDTTPSGSDDELDARKRRIVDM